MRCSGCGKELKPKAKSCPNCGRLVTTRDRFSFKSNESYSGVLHQQGRVMVDEDYSEEVKLATERKEKIEIDTDTQPRVSHKPIRIIDDSTTIDSTGITFNVTSGIIPVGDVTLSFDEPEEGISATAMDPDSEITLDSRKYIVYLEVWETTVSSVEDSDLIATGLEGHDTSTQFHVGFRWSPYTRKIETNADFADFLKSQKKNHTHKHLVPLAILEVTKQGQIKATHYSSESADLLKPHSTISVKSLGSKMDGSYSVTTVRHKIGDSVKSEFIERIQCEYCGTENDRTSIFCKNCGSRIAS